VSSNLAQPAGVLSWERDFLLGLAVDALGDFVGNTNEEAGDSMKNTGSHATSCWRSRSI
jgi:hypothetical protein